MEPGGTEYLSHQNLPHQVYFVLKDIKQPGAIELGYEDRKLMRN